MTPFRVIVFPVDFSPAVKAFAPYVRDMAQHFECKVVLVHAFDAIPDYLLAPRFEVPGGPEPREIPYTPAVQELRNARKHLLELFAQAELGSASYDTVIEDGEPVAVIEWAVRRMNAGIVMMPTSGHGKFRRLLMGSVTAKVLHDLNCPIFTSAHQPRVPAASPDGYRSIVCAVELNPEAESVLQAAGIVSQAYGSKVCVVHVETPPQGSDHTTPAESLREMLRRVSQAYGIQLEADAKIRVLDCAVPEGVRRAAIEEQADLLVVGRGREKAGFSRVWSQLYAIIGESPCPVLSV